MLNRLSAPPIGSEGEDESERRVAGRSISISCWRRRAARRGSSAAAAVAGCWGSPTPSPRRRYTPRPPTS